MGEPAWTAPRGRTSRRRSEHSSRTQRSSNRMVILTGGHPSSTYSGADLEGERSSKDEMRQRNAMPNHSRQGVAYSGPSPVDDGPPGVPRWWRGPEPDVDHIRRLYAEKGYTEDEIAAELSVSRPRVAAVLRASDVARRPPAKRCPLSDDALRALVNEGITKTALGDRFGVVRNTVDRWLAEAGVLELPSDIDVGVLHNLYVDQQLTTREVAQELGLSKGRVIVLLATAGIARRPRSARRPRGARAAVTDAALAEVYQRPGMTILTTAAHFGVSGEFVRRRVAEAGLTKRIGSFTLHCPYTPAEC